MPTYQYRCRDCGEDLEVVQSFTDDALTTCPACQGSLKKVFSAVGISFKGSGFYKTDSRGSTSKSASGATTSESGSSSNGSSSDSGSSTSSDSGSSSTSSAPASSPSPSSSATAST
jgi:putative FmdB family regulatory protein